MAEAALSLRGFYGAVGTGKIIRIVSHNVHCKIESNFGRKSHLLESWFYVGVGYFNIPMIQNIKAHLKNNGFGKRHEFLE